jgi:hypothetical protein
MTDEKEYVIYNGKKVVSYWPARIEKAQQITTYTIGGKEFGRIRYGDESDDWGSDRHPCGDCAVVKGQFHVPNCDVEECPNCRGQVLSCDCEYEGDDEEVDDGAK